MNQFLHLTSAFCLSLLKIDLDSDLQRYLERILKNISVMNMFHLETMLVHSHIKSKENVLLPLH